MSSLNKFTLFDIKKMSNQNIWNGCIKNIPSTSNNENDKYILYSTGNASIIYGREYVCVPAGKVLTRDDKIKYNIW
tara:strand:+ start:243 stop:470 length:228 start_codon:yes stop_codon:yes gene_type:complete